MPIRVSHGATPAVQMGSHYGAGLIRGQQRVADRQMDYLQHQQRQGLQQEALDQRRKMLQQREGEFLLERADSAYNLDPQSGLEYTPRQKMDLARIDDDIAAVQVDEVRFGSEEEREEALGQLYARREAIRPVQRPQGPSPEEAIRANTREVDGVSYARDPEKGWVVDEFKEKQKAAFAEKKADMMLKAMEMTVTEKGPADKEGFQEDIEKPRFKDAKEARKFVEELFGAEEEEEKTPEPTFVQGKDGTLYEDVPGKGLKRVPVAHEEKAPQQQPRDPNAPTPLELEWDAERRDEQVHRANAAITKIMQGRMLGQLSDDEQGAVEVWDILRSENLAGRMWDDDTLARAVQDVAARRAARKATEKAQRIEPLKPGKKGNLDDEKDLVHRLLPREIPQ